LSASEAKKRRRAAFKARVDALRASKVLMSDNGRIIEPGTREYEKRLEKTAAMLSQEEFLGLIGH
jgi:hypothetical protein